MFSNGTQYECFLEQNCEKCHFFVYYEDATEKNPVCSIEDRIAQSSALDREEAIKIFPYEWLDKNDSMSLYNCRKHLGKELHFKTIDKLQKQQE
jgi:hypothetical protein